MYHNFKAVWKWYTFKINRLDEPVEIHEKSEGMARYRAMNIYHTDEMELISEREG